MKRIFLFLVTNLAVMLLLTVTAHLLGLNRFIEGNGINFSALLLFAALFGFGGSFISLAMSKWMAKMSTGAQVIDRPRDAVEQWLVDTVARFSREAGIAMPEVAIYDSPDVNAFATGPSKNNSLVAVSTGLLASMTREEAEAVIGHEVAHVANGDMVTLTLIQGVVNTFVIAAARIVGYFVDRALQGNNDDEGYQPGIGYMITTLVAELLLGILASMVVMWFSRQREFRADTGGASLAGTRKMIAALERLRAIHEPSHLPDQMAAFGINSGGGMGLRKLFMSHPPLEERIEALRARLR